MEHCWEYGFILRYPEGTEEITGIVYEPWHYRYVGEEAAKAIMEKELRWKNIWHRYKNKQEEFLFRKPG